MLSLLGAPDKAAALIKERLRPAARPDPKRVSDRIAALDGDFDEREAATKELAALGEAAEPALREALTGKPAPEVKARCERLLESVQKGEAGPDDRRGRRAVQVLEGLATPEASAALKGLAEGAPGRLIRAAKLALDQTGRPLGDKERLGIRRAGGVSPLITALGR